MEFSKRDLQIIRRAMSDYNRKCSKVSDDKYNYEIAQTFDKVVKSLKLVK